MFASKLDRRLAELRASTQQLDRSLSAVCQGDSQPIEITRKSYGWQIRYVDPMAPHRTIYCVHADRRSARGHARMLAGWPTLIIERTPVK